MLWYLFNSLTIFEISLVLGLYYFSSMAPLVFSLCMVLYDLYNDLSRNASSKLTCTDMKAALYSHCNGYEVTRIPVPKFAPDELLVRVKAAAISPADFKVKIINFLFLRWFGHPTVGRDFSGVVVDVGSRVKDFRIGDEVFGNALGGSLQEYTVVKSSHAEVKPRHLSFAQSAALGLSGATSLQALTYFDKSLKNKKVLVVGGSGGCGSYGVEIAKRMSAEVHSVCSADNISYVKSLGATAYDYNSKADMAQLRKVEFELVYDTVSSWDARDGDLTSLYSTFLGEDGKYVAINGNKLSMFIAIVSSITGINLGKASYHISILNWNRENLTNLKQMAESDSFRTRCTEYSLNNEDVRKAFEKLESRRTVGKIVINLSSN